MCLSCNIANNVRLGSSVTMREIAGSQEAMREKLLIDNFTKTMTLAVLGQTYRIFADAVSFLRKSGRNGTYFPNGLWINRLFLIFTRFHQLT